MDQRGYIQLPLASKCDPATSVCTRVTLLSSSLKRKDSIGLRDRTCLIPKTWGCFSSSVFSLSQSKSHWVPFVAGSNGMIKEEVFHWSDQTICSLCCRGEFTPRRCKVMTIQASGLWNWMVIKKTKTYRYEHTVKHPIACTSTQLNKTKKSLFSNHACVTMLGVLHQTARRSVQSSLLLENTDDQYAWHPGC